MARQQGKSQASIVAKEFFLNAGKAVMVINAEGATIQKRFKHLTSITPVKKKEKTALLIIDDFKR